MCLHKWGRPVQCEWDGEDRQPCQGSRTGPEVIPAICVEGAVRTMTSSGNQPHHLLHEQSNEDAGASWSPGWHRGQSFRLAVWEDMVLPFPTHIKVTVLVLEIPLLFLTCWESLITSGKSITKASSVGLLRCTTPTLFYQNWFSKEQHLVFLPHPHPIPPVLTLSSPQAVLPRLLSAPSSISHTFFFFFF